MGGLFQLFGGRGRDFQELGHCPLFGLLWAALEFVVAPTGVSFSVLICYNKSTMRLKCWNSNLLPSWPLVSFNQFLSYPQWSCHSFTGCTLTPSLLSHVQAHSDYCRSSDCRNEILVFLLIAGEVPPSALRWHSHVLTSWFLPSQG